MASTRQPTRRLLTQNHSPLYVCRSCRTHTNPPRVAATQQRTLFDTESIRKKIWGTDNPPGLKDPYGGPSFLEKRKMRKEAEARAARQESQEQDVPSQELADAEIERAPGSQATPSQRVPLERYREALNWNGLKRMGHRGDWTTMEPVPEDDYVPWLGPTPRKAVSSRPKIKSYFHRALVECYACQQANADTATVLVLDSTSSVRTIREPYKTIIERARIVPSANGDTYEVVFASAQDEAVLMKRMTDVVEGEPIEASEEDNSEAALDGSAGVQSEIQSQGQSDGLESLRLNLNDPLTFLVLKRYALLTGNRVPDHALSEWAHSGKGLSFLFDRLSAQPKDSTQTVNQVLPRQPALKAQPNVAIIYKKESEVSRDKSVGRWKVIVQELQDRGLVRSNLKASSMGKSNYLPRRMPRS